MLNTEDFIKRLKKIIEFYDESASSFAEEINVQRSSISHILSGRNKPSLEFILKILSSYPDVNLYWLINGKGDFLNTTNSEKNEVSENQNIKNKNLFSNVEKNSASQENNSPIENVLGNNKIENSKKEIDRIVIFFKDGSFSNFKN